VEVVTFAFQFDSLNMDTGVPILCIICSINYCRLIFMFGRSNRSSIETEALLFAKEKVL
jgi:hypothetical protein